MEAAQAEVKRNLQRNGRGNNHDHGQTVQETLQKFFYRETQSKPVIFSNIVNV